MCAAPGAQRSIERRVAIGPDGDRSAIALGDRIRRNSRVADIGGLRVGDLALAVKPAADCDGAAAAIARRIDLGAIAHIHRGPGDGNGAARLARTAPGGIDRSTGIHRAIGACVQDNFTVVHRSAGRLDHAGVVDDVVLDAARGARGQENGSARSRYRSRIGNKCGLGILARVIDRRGDAVADKIVAIQIDGERLGPAEYDRAEIGLDYPFVGNLRRRQHHRAAIGGGDRALIYDRSARIGGRFREAETAVAEIIVADVRGRGQQRAHIHLRALAEQNTVGVDQPDISVCEQLPADGRCLGPGDPVDGKRCAVGLVEHNRGAARYREAVPVDQRLGAGLIHNRLRAAGRGDGGAADRNRTTRGPARHSRRGAKQGGSDKPAGCQQKPPQYSRSRVLHHRKLRSQNVIATSTRALLTALPLSLPGTACNVRAPSTAR